jgi:RHS repeat-associated protein
VPSPLGQLVPGSSTGGQDEPLYNWAISSYAPDGDVLAMTDAVMGTWSYSYDDMNRLTSGTATSGQDVGLLLTWQYDRYGNRWNQTASTAPGYNPPSGDVSAVQPQLTFNGNNNRIDGWLYDTAGDLTHDGLGNTYSYDDDGMLTSVNGAQYVYDALKLRVAKTGGSNPTETIYFGGKAIALHNATSGAWTDLIWAGEGMIAEVAGTTKTTLPVYRLLDHEGSLTMTTDGSGNVTGTNLMGPYGETLSSSTSDPYAYTGLYQDTEYGGHDAWFRNLSTEQTRWLTPDPYNGSYDPTNPQSFNRYSYVLNNPLGFTDPTGLWCFYGGPGDKWTTDQNSDDFDFNSIPQECGDSGGQWQAPPSIRETITVNGTNPDLLSQYTNLFYSPGVSNPAPLSSSGSNAPNNSNYCSVLDPNCKKPGPVANYLSFLACEYNDTIEQITDQEDGQGTNSPSATPAAKLTTIPLLVYGIVGPTKPWVKVTSTATLSSIMLGTAAHANKACSPSFFGH